tara:strand:+ start:145 stop:258 length:114 start_codon:yes stop_codon:yes gene_type:complete
MFKNDINPSEPNKTDGLKGIQICGFISQPTVLLNFST